MDRQIVYAGAIPQDVDQLLQNRNTMVGLGYALQAILGATTLFDGLACTPTAPPSLTVNAAAGSVYAIENVDNSAFGSLAADTSHQIIKQGIVDGPSSFTLFAPSTSGFSIVFLIEGAYEDADNGPTVLPYYNASNPSVAFNGPNNTGVSQNTVRKGICNLQVKTGVAATTGTQVTPAPDAGFTGLFAITVANGQTTITSGDIQQLGTAPFIATKLSQLGALARLGVGSGLSTDGTLLYAVNKRLTLGGNLTLYVSTTGSDSNNGLSSGSPFLTRQHAVNTAYSYDVNGFSITIQHADGTYTDSCVISGPLVGSTGPSSLIFNGNSATPSNVVFSTTGQSCIQATNGASITVQNFKGQTTTSGNVISSTNGSITTLAGSYEFGSCAGFQISAGNGGVINSGTSYKISGGAIAHASANSGQINIGAPTITLTGTPAFSEFVQSTNSGNVSCVSGTTTFSGSATGLRFTANANGVINTAGSSATFFPGNAAGTQATGGQYT